MSTQAFARRAAGPIFALAIVVAGCTGGNAATTAPIITAAPTGPAATTAAIATSAPTRSAAPSVIPDGMYAAQVAEVADMQALIKADAKLTAAQRAQIESDFSFGNATTSQNFLAFHGGQMTESGGYDGGPAQVGARATYAFPDNHTLVIQETCCSNTFQVTWAGSAFTLRVLSGTPNTELDIVENKLVYEWSPFTLVP